MYLLLVAAMLVAGRFISKLKVSGVNDIVPLAVLIVGYIAYIILHEATHGLIMYLSVKAKLNFGFKGWAAYAGSSGYFDKTHYILIALAPLVLWGIIFGILTAFFHGGVWFWVIWLLQTGNVSGAAGDIYCTYKMLTFSGDILVNDTGLEMTVYRKTAFTEAATEEKNDNGEQSVD